MHQETAKNVFIRRWRLYTLEPAWIFSSSAHSASVTAAFKSRKGLKCTTHLLYFHTQQTHSLHDFCLGGVLWGGRASQQQPPEHHPHHPLEALLWLSCGRRISVSYITGVYSSFGSHLACFSIISFIEPSLVSTLISSLFFCPPSLAKSAILFVAKVGSFE